MLEFGLTNLKTTAEVVVNLILAKTLKRASNNSMLLLSKQGGVK